MQLFPRRRHFPMIAGPVVLVALSACEFTQTLPDAPRGPVFDTASKPPTIFAEEEGLTLPPPGAPLTLPPPDAGGGSGLVAEALPLPEAPASFEAPPVALEAFAAPQPVIPSPPPAPVPEAYTVDLTTPGAPVALSPLPQTTAIPLPEAPASLPPAAAQPEILFSEDAGTPYIQPAPAVQQVTIAPSPALETRADPVPVQITPTAPPRQVAVTQPLPQPTVTALTAAPLPAPRPVQPAAPAPTALAGGESGSLFALAPNGASVAVAPLTGGDADRLYLIADATAAQIGGRSTRAAHAGAAKRYRLEGRAVAMEGDGKVTLVTDWRLRNDRNQVVGDFYEKQSLPAAGSGDPWAVLTDDMLVAIGRRSADRLMRSGMLGDTMAQVASAPARETRPVTSVPITPVAAAPAPQPVAIAPAPQPAPTVRRVTQMAPIPDPEPVRVAAPAPSFETFRAPAPSATGRRPIVMRGVFGAPGDGGTALAREIRTMLAGAGESFANDGNPDAFYLGAQVSKNRTGRIDQIRIVWRLEDAQGRSIGQVVQENEVPAGALDGAWGEDASFAAEGAREGLNRLLAEARAVLG